MGRTIHTFLISDEKGSLDSISQIIIATISRKFLLQTVFRWRSRQCASIRAA